MKILKIFGIVVGIHLFALILIFANPGCSSTTKSAPAPGETAAKTPAPSVASAPASGSSAASGLSGSTVASDSPSSSAITFNPNAPAAPAPAASTGERFVPTRPNSPVAGALLAEPVSDVTPATSYTVKSGDNLWTIARKNNITVAQLTAANNLSANASLRPGQKLIIPGKTMSAAASAPAPAAAIPAKAADVSSAAASRSSSEGVKHIVKSGETLGAIARKYDVRQGELAVANNISDPAKIRPGMELIIPGYHAPSAKAEKSTKTKSGKAPQPSAPPAAEPLPPAPAIPVTPAPVPVIRLDDVPTTKQP